MNSRLLQFLTAENITQAQFADSIGVARASISHIISGRNKPSYEFISAMMKQYPQLNPEWLILGKGRMYNDASRQTQQQQSKDIPGEDLLFPAEYDSPQVSPTMQQVLQVKPAASRLNSKIFQDGSQLENKTTSGGTIATEPEAMSQQPKSRITSSEKQIQERKISKIIIFFDDGTFQEMRS